MKKVFLKIRSISASVLHVKIFASANFLIIIASAIITPVALLNNNRLLASSMLCISVIAMLAMILAYLVFILPPAIKKLYTKIISTPAPELSFKILIPATIAAAMALILQLALPFLF